MCKLKEKKYSFTVENYGSHHPSQVITVNTLRDKSRCYIAPDKEQGNFIPVAFILGTHNSSLIMTESSDKSKLRNILENS